MSSPYKMRLHSQIIHYLINWALLHYSYTWPLKISSPATANLTPKYTSTSTSISSNTTITFLSAWMGSLPNNTKITNILIPGTHDSGTDWINSLTPYSKTQTWSISDQLKIGIRFWDIRICPNKNNNNIITLCHGPMNTNRTIETIFKTISDFLEAHPTEGLVLNIKNEKNDFNTLLDKHITYILELYKEYIIFPRGNYIPTVGELRKHVVIFFQGVYLSKYPYTNWGDKSTFWIQDNYRYVYSGRKKGKIWTFDEQCKMLSHLKTDFHKYFINMFSASGLSGGNWMMSNWKIARIMNELIEDVSCRKGIFVFDYPSVTLVKKVVFRNEWVDGDS